MRRTFPLEPALITDLNRDITDILINKQECIPVGCVPAGRRPYSEVCFPGEGVCLVRGGGSPSLVRGGLPGLGGFYQPGGGGCLPGPRGVCLVQGGSAWSGGFSQPGPGGSAWSGGVLPAWEGCLPGPGGFSQPGWGRSAWFRGGLPGPGGLPAWRTPPVNRITDTCKNITLATTSLRPVINTSNFPGAALDELCHLVV